MKLLDNIKIFFETLSIPKKQLKTGCIFISDYFNNSSCKKNSKSIEKVCYNLRILAHVLEKGMSLPKVRKGFGKEKVKQLLDNMDEYIKIGDFKYDVDAFDNAYGALSAYVENASEFECDVSFINLDKYRFACCSKKKCGINYYHNIGEVDIGNDFKEFAFRRHSVRSFSSEPIRKESLEEVAKLAQTAPSACNRQSVRIIHISDKKLASKILELQGGAKGHDVSELLLVASDLRYHSQMNEITIPYLDCGIYIMNLLYSLKYYGFDSCPLIWNDNERGKGLRKLLAIPKYLQVVSVIQFGVSKNGDYKYAVSSRREVSSVLIEQTTYEDKELIR